MYKVYLFKKIISMEFSKSRDTHAFEELQSRPAEQSEYQQKTDPLKTKRIANGFQVTKYYSRFVILQKLYCIALLIQLFLSFLYYQLEYKGNSHSSSIILNFMLINLIQSIILSTLTYLSYNDLKKSQIKAQQTLQIVDLLFSWLIILIQPYSFLQNYYIQNWNYRNNVQILFKLNYLLVILSLLKLILILSAILNLLKYKNPRSSRVSKMYGFSNSKLFEIKCIFKNYPMLLLANIVVFCILFFSFAYRVSERDSSIIPDYFDDYGNCIWLVILTMTTVGYGDFYPITFLGRSFGFLCTFCGAMTVSLIVLVIINTFQMDNSQDQALSLLKTLSNKKQIKRLAGQYIRTSLWRLWRNKQLMKSGLYTLVIQQTREQKAIKNSLRQKIRQTKQESDVNEKKLGQEMRREFQKLSFNIENINKNCDLIMGYLSNQYLIDIGEMKDSKLGGMIKKISLD